ncbi:huntingtin-associated protein 1 isoform X2 [Gracilinanus agilis]|uniref:huntingtin-associated protein 1 isoform X2 n=1 Tax=Gracilinanus agilis TaxID=191870 RepID=UPI001CFD195C|nr:huntingtin-associated protein 1 isoform X2 [Gracilinanus agilis]
MEGPVTVEIWSSPAAYCAGGTGPERTSELLIRELEEVLCSERVSQVTKTYHDIEAVTSLLEEKERDLELAARIGQSLLKQNCSLSKQNELLEEQLELAREEIAQLRHEVAMRDNLLHLYTDTVEESEPSSAAPTPLRHCDSSVSLQHCIQLDTLQQKLRGLEEENQQLRLEATSIVTETCQYEDQEQQLMLDCVEQFSEVSQQVALLSEELARKTEDQARQQEEISTLLAQIVGLQQRCRAYGTEMEELQQHLASAREVQRKLRTEVQDLQEKYAECDGLLNEAQEELKKLRLQSLPSGTISHYNSVYSLPLDSLAAEIKGTMRKGTESPSSLDYRNMRRVFETVKAVNQGTRPRSGSGSLHPLPGSPPPSVAGSPSGTPHPKYNCLDRPCGVLPLEEASGEEEEKKVGFPGTPGNQDLELALQRLTAWKEAQEAEPNLEKLGQDAESSSGVLTPSESLLSGSSDPPAGSIFSMGSLSFLPDKLQIVKPLEGSVTLHHWQQLAQPHLAGILDPRPGVLTKDFRQLEVDVEKVYSLQDPEEDEEEEEEEKVIAASRASLAKDKTHPLYPSHLHNHYLPPGLPLFRCDLRHPQPLPFRHPLLQSRRGHKPHPSTSSPGPAVSSEGTGNLCCLQAYIISTSGPRLERLASGKLWPSQGTASGWVRGRWREDQWLQHKFGTEATAAGTRSCGGQRSFEGMASRGSRAP